MGESWTCPYCNRPCTVDADDVRVLKATGYVSEEYGHYVSETTIIVCPNKRCRKKSISLRISQFHEGKKLYSWQLLPESDAKPFPDYIPKPLLDDYREACLIKDKSPKASATLSRRCLQGMIRDFWGIKKAILKEEVAALKEKVDDTTWQAIDSVREVGNIGAHMEKDVNLIIDVDPEEAGLLIWLIETLFAEWYIAKHEKESKMAALTELAKSKKSQKDTQPSDTTGGKKGS